MACRRSLIRISHGDFGADVSRLQILRLVGYGLRWQFLCLEYRWHVLFWGQDFGSCFFDGTADLLQGC